MIEELTPQLLAVALILVIGVASLLSVVISAVLLTTYRHSVVTAMGRASAAGLTHGEVTAVLPGAPVAAVDGPVAEDGGYDLAVRRARFAVLRTATSGGALMLVFTLAAMIAFAELRSAGRAVLSLWVFAWPTVMALALMGAAGARPRWLGVGGYVALFLAGAVFGAIASEIAGHWFGTEGAGYLTAITPPQIIGAWLVVNGVPSCMLAMCLNRRIRAVGPLVLGFATVLTSACMAVMLWLMTPQGGCVLDALPVIPGLSPRPPARCDRPLLAAHRLH